MENQNAVYQLEQVCDDPRFEGFTPAVRGDLPDSFPRDRRSRKWRVFRFAKWWKPMKAVGRVRPFNDNPGVTGLNLADPKSKGSKTERAQIKRLEDQLDALLVDNSQAPPVGNLEGHDFKAGKCRMILSCPDANALEKKIAPLLKKLDWANGFTLKKHRNEYYTLKDWWD